MRKSLSILLLVVCMLGAFGCNADIETINYAYEYRIAQDLKEMSSKADIIVLGSYQKYLTSYNGDRDVKDPSRESTQSYSEVKIYEFKVDEVIKGNVPNDIHVNLHYSRQITELLDSKGNPIKLNIKSETFFEPEDAITGKEFKDLISEIKQFVSN